MLDHQPVDAPAASSSKRGMLMLSLVGIVVFTALAALMVDWDDRPSAQASESANNPKRSTPQRPRQAPDTASDKDPESAEPELDAAAGMGVASALDGAESGNEPINAGADSTSDETEDADSSEARASSPSASQAKPADTGVDSTRVGELLLYMQEQLGVGFVLQKRSLVDDEGKALRVNFMPPANPSQQELRILLYESLRSVGRVLIPIKGSDPTRPTYHILTASEAAGYSVVTNDISKLDGYYFGSLSFEARSLSVEELEEILRPSLSEHGQLLKLPNTSKLVASDYIDNLRAMAELTLQANEPAMRDDDSIHRVYKPLRHDPQALRLSVMDAQQSGEDYAVTLFASGGALLVTGSRVHVEAAIERLAALDARITVEAPPVQLREYLVKVRPLREVDEVMREFFQREFKAGQIRMTSFEPRNLLLIECTDALYQQVLRFLAEVDRTPRSVDEAQRESRHDERAPQGDDSPSPAETPRE